MGLDVVTGALAADENEENPPKSASVVGLVVVTGALAADENEVNPPKSASVVG